MQCSAHPAVNTSVHLILWIAAEQHVWSRHLQKVGRHCCQGVNMASALGAIDQSPLQEDTSHTSCSVLQQQHNSAIQHKPTTQQPANSMRGHTGITQKSCNNTIQWANTMRAWCSSINMEEVQ